MPMTINGSGTITGLTAGGLPDATIVQADLATGVAGNGPAFSAIQTGAQSVSSATWTKVQLTAENFDTANCFDSTTNYRFTPNVAGYYHLSYGLFLVGSSPTAPSLGLWKNGSLYSYAAYIAGSVGNVIISGSSVVYFNGTTDYAELYGNVTGTSLFFGSAGNSTLTQFSGALVRAA